MDNIIIAVFGNEATAEAFKLTAYHFGHDRSVERIGSALRLSEGIYNEVLAKTYAVPAAIVAEEVK